MADRFVMPRKWATDRHEPPPRPMLIGRYVCHECGSHGTVIQDADCEEILCLCGAVAEPICEE